MTLRRATATLVILAALLAGWAVGRASDRDETSLTVRVSSSDHEMQEGYFTLGDSVTVLAKPGSDLHRFLTRQRNRKVTLSVAQATVPELSRLQR